MKKTLLPILLVMSLLTACSSDRPLNPSFALKVSDAYGAMTTMESEPRELVRPVIIAAGLYDPGYAAFLAAEKLRCVCDNPEMVVPVGFSRDLSFDACRERLVGVIEERFPSDDPDRTVEVDIVGVSMGGLVGRYAALERFDGGKRVHINRLFTIAAPHRGTARAHVPTFETRVLEMRPDSYLLKRIRANEPPPEPYELYPYVRLGDITVGTKNAAPEGKTAWWVQNQPFQLAHLFASNDPRILADIARRLRYEPSYATDPPAPLPGTKPKSMDEDAE